MWWSNKRLDEPPKVLIQKNNKRSVIFLPKIAIKQPITPSIPIARVALRDLWRQSTTFAIPAILNFVSTSNFISIRSPTFYKLSMIRFVRNAHFDVDF